MFVNKSTMAQAQALLDYWELANHHNQMVWVGSVHPDLEVQKFDEIEVNVCATSSCAAGTVVFLNSTLKEFKEYAYVNSGDSSFWMGKAGPLLGLETHEECYRLFYSDNASARRMVQALAEGDKQKFWSERRVQV